MEAVIFVGIQASGKTTFYKEVFFRTHLRINLDMLKTRHRETVILEACIHAKQRFVVDNTNVQRIERQKYIVHARNAGFKVIGYYFDADINEALKRNSQRTGKELVPEVGVRGTYNRLEIPVVYEGFDRLYRVFVEKDGGFAVTSF